MRKMGGKLFEDQRRLGEMARWLLDLTWKEYMINKILNALYNKI